MAEGWASRRITFTAIFLVVWGLVSYRQYLKYLDGRGFASMVLPAGASSSAQLVFFVAIPVVAAIAFGFGVSRELERQ
jgi:hypothetical protein